MNRRHVIAFFLGVLVVGLVTYIVSYRLESTDINKIHARQQHRVIQQLNKGTFTVFDPASTPQLLSERIRSLSTTNLSADQLTSLTTAVVEFFRCYSQTNFNQYVSFKTFQGNFEWTVPNAGNTSSPQKEAERRWAARAAALEYRLTNGPPTAPMRIIKFNLEKLVMDIRPLFSTNAPALELQQAYTGICISRGGFAKSFVTPATLLNEPGAKVVWATWTFPCIAMSMRGPTEPGPVAVSAFWDAINAKWVLDTCVSASPPNFLPIL